MSTESNDTAAVADNGQGVGFDNQTTQQPTNTDGIMDYSHSPHKGVKLDDDKAEGTQMFFGKYKTMEDAETGYKNAEKKIQEQGTELNKLKAETGKFEPLNEESYSPDKWKETVEKWKTDKIIPDAIYDSSIPEIDLLMSGCKEAKVSEAQMQSILKGAVDRQQNMLAEQETKLKEELGAEGNKKIEQLGQFAQKLSGEDYVLFENILSVPFVTAGEVDLMHRLLIGEGEKPIPTTPGVSAQKSSSDIYKEILQFKKEYEKELPADSNLQQMHDELWGKYAKAQEREGKR